MRLVRTFFAFEETQRHISDVGSIPLIESYLVQYLLISFYSEFEEAVKYIILERLNNIQDRKVASFVFKTNEAMLKRVKKGEINDTLRKFDCGEGDVISKLMPDVNLQPYHDAITNRHLVSHKDGSNMTLDEFGKVLPCAEAILNILQATLSIE
jgi:hypothetical protein